MARNPQATHWYFIYSDFCPACGATKETRERRFTPRPKKWQDRHQQTESYDYCIG
jgi:hypothetical protein